MHDDDSVPTNIHLAWSVSLSRLFGRRRNRGNGKSKGQKGRRLKLHQKFIPFVSLVDVLIRSLLARSPPGRQRCAKARALSELSCTIWLATGVHAAALGARVPACRIAAPSWSFRWSDFSPSLVGGPTEARRTPFVLRSMRFRFRLSRRVNVLLRLAARSCACQTLKEETSVTWSKLGGSTRPRLAARAVHRLCLSPTQTPRNRLPPPPRRGSLDGRRLLPRPPPYRPCRAWRLICPGQ